MKDAVDTELHRAQSGLTHLESMAKDAAHRDLRRAGDEIEHLEGLAKEQLEKLGGGSNSSEEGIGRGKRREG